MALKDFFQKLSKLPFQKSMKKASRVKSKTAKTSKKSGSLSKSSLPKNKPEHPSPKSNPEEHSNRFLKFYHNNKGRLLKERKSLYYQKKQKGLCVRCNKKVLQDIIFCEYHQQKQVTYNKVARQK